MIDSNEHLAIWKQVEKTDPEVTKSFNNGSFRGTSINPIYLARRATEIFGPIGIGWGHEEIESKIVDGAVLDEAGQCEKVWFTHVRVWYVWEGKRGEVSQWGATTYVTRTKGSGDKPGYWKTDEEAAKKSRTDGITKCLSLLGFSADIWMGYYDNPAYREQRQREVEVDRAKQTHENAFKTLKAELYKHIGCRTEEDANLVIRWAVQKDGKPVYADLEEVKETEGAPARVITTIMKRVDIDRECIYPEILQRARDAASNGKPQKAGAAK